MNITIMSRLVSAFVVINIHELLYCKYVIVLQPPLPRKNLNLMIDTERV